MLSSEQSAALENLCNMANAFALVLREFAHAFRGHEESFPAFIEAAAVPVPPLDGWTPELIEHWRKNEATPAIWDALPECLKTPPAGFRWLEFAADTPEGPEICNTLMKAAA